MPYLPHSGEDLEYKYKFEIWKRYLSAGPGVGVFSTYHPPTELVNHWQDRLNTKVYYSLSKYTTHYLSILLTI